MAEVDRRRALRRTAGLAALAGGLALIASTFLGWITTPMQPGGTTSISGWGTISGGSDLVDGVNLNTLMAGMGSYRPAVPVVIVGAVTVIPALVLAVTGPGVRPRRIVGAILVACGLVATGWALAMVIVPGDALGVLPDGEHAAGFGPMLATVAGMVILVAGGLGLFGRLDPPERVAARGIQPRR
jgi:hypothetical protein